MQVFKLCLKILKKNIRSLLIYIVLFLGISTIMASSASTEQNTDFSFTKSKARLAIISEESTPLTAGLQQELAKIAHLVALPDEIEALQDALYFRTVSYILRIPKGFSEKIMRGQPVKLHKTVIPNSYSNAYLDLSIDQYLNSARLYVEQIEDLSQEELVQFLQKDLAVETAVEIKTNDRQAAKQTYSQYFFNYLSYSLLSILILGLSALLLVFNNQDLQKRNACAPLSTANVNRQFVLAVLVFTVLTWLVMALLCLVFALKDGFTVNILYLLLNSFIFALCAASISYLIGTLVKSPNAIPAISNVVTLGLSFISGVFVPMELLGKQVLKFASFTPTYWYVTANNRLASLTKFNYTNLQPVFTSMLIQLGFALAFFAVALVLGKNRRLQ
ncbi:MAG TPA: ABC transporter permease [Firmicutes bacterium]|jgi:ABC-2 type transport system permease protein|nr:ABC transporter permease [Bacillota bacterium]HAA37510.1 ABC transporter permease [Bacillota bacterium]